MGSGSLSRKAADSPKIALKEKKGSGSGGSSSQNSSGITCPPGFEVKLPSNIKLLHGTSLQLHIEGDVVIVTTRAGKEIINLGKTKSKTIIKCVNDGIIYTGKIVVKGANTYASFSRTN